MPRSTLSAHEPEPAWDIARLFPPQGEWSEEEYLDLDTNRLVEFSDGYVEVLPMPTMYHQLVAAYLYGLLLAFVSSRKLGTVMYAGIRVRISGQKYREPDVLFLAAEHEEWAGNKYWTGADLVMEVVSEGDADRERDLKNKRKEYAEAGIPEYWIVDPQEGAVLVLRLRGKQYVAHSQCGKGMKAESRLLPGFAVSVDELFDRGPALPEIPRRKPRKAR